MIAPTPRALRVAAIGLPMAALPIIIHEQLWVVWFAYAVAILLLLSVDAVLVASGGIFNIDAHLPDILHIGTSSTGRLKIKAAENTFPSTIECLLQFDENLARTQIQIMAMGPDGEGELTFPLTPVRRGIACLEHVSIRWSGPLGFIRRARTFSLRVEVQVIPNIQAVRDWAQKGHSAKEVGSRIQTFIGGGSEFEQLREFTPGLDQRGIDWKASARHAKLLVREFRAERNQHVYLAFDTGRLMGLPLGGIPRLDHAVNSGLMLAYAALRCGDRVGVYGFSERPEVFAPAQSGLRSINPIQSHLAGLEYGAKETNFTVGLLELLSRLRRRSLVIVFTDFVDSVTAGLMMENLGRLAKRHLVIFVSYRDRDLDGLADVRPGVLTDLHQAVVANDFRTEREAVLKKLNRLGILHVEGAVDRVTPALLSQYLEVKRREMV
jgi:uncharacterized protein (DUF58 family)